MYIIEVEEKFAANVHSNLKSNRTNKNNSIIINNRFTVIANYVDMLVK